MYNTQNVERLRENSLNTKQQSQRIATLDKHEEVVSYKGE